MQIRCVTSRGLHDAVFIHKDNMAESRNVLRRGGKYCVAGGPNDVSCMNTSYTTGISMHKFPKDENQRKKWTKFVRKHRAKFEPSKTSALCSAHFESTCYVRRLDISLKDGEDPSTPSPTLLKRLEAGAVPTIDTVVPIGTPTETRRGRRQVSQVNHSCKSPTWNGTFILMYLLVINVFLAR